MRARSGALLAFPLGAWFALFLLVPIAFIFVYSVSTRGGYGQVLFGLSSDNFFRAMEPLYLRIFWNSLKLAGWTTAACLLIGYPMAYVLATARPKLRPLLLTLVVIPFWTNFVVRTYALKIALAAFSANTTLLVLLGMVTNYLPFMVLPLYVALEKFDFSLLEAARDLGASPAQVFFRVLLPLTKPGIVTGSIFVFTPALGEFVIPDLLGGAKTMLIGNLITDQFLKTRDWPFGSAVSLLLLLVAIFSLVIYLGHQTRKEAKRAV